MIRIDEEFWASWTVQCTKDFVCLGFCYGMLRDQGTCFLKVICLYFAPWKITIDPSCAESIFIFLGQPSNFTKQGSLRDAFGKQSQRYIQKKYCGSRSLHLGVFMLGGFGWFGFTGRLASPQKTTGWWDKVVLASMMFVGMQLVANDRTKVSFFGGKQWEKRRCEGKGSEGGSI